MTTISTSPIGVSFPPFASTDSRVVMDYGVGSNKPWSLDNTTLSAQYGFAVIGSGVSFDPALGVKPGIAGGLRSTTALTGAPTAQGTIYVKFERAAMAEVVQQGGTTFFDSAGVYGVFGNLIEFGVFNANYVKFYTNATSGATQTLQLNVDFASATEQNNVTPVTHFNSHASHSFQDQRFAELVFTWKGGFFYIYIDGHLFMPGTPFAAPPTSALFSAMNIGCSGGPTLEFGNFWINRVQVSNVFAQIPMTGAKTALLGDSFVENATGQNDPGADTVAGINAVQGFTTIAARGATGGLGYQGGAGQCLFGACLQSMAAQQLGFYFPMFNSSRSGKGWAHDNGSGSTASWEIPQAYGDAIIQYSPEILICLGSVNDYSLGAPLTLLGTDTKAKLDYITAGKSGGTNWANGVTQYPKRLRAILFFEAFTWEGTASGLPFPTEPAIAQFNAQQQRAALSGQSSNGVPIYWGDTRPNWNPAIPGYLTWFQSTNNPNNSTTLNDGHPSATGRTLMPNLMASTFLNVMAARPTRSAY